MDGLDAPRSAPRRRGRRVTLAVAYTAVALVFGLLAADAQAGGPATRHVPVRPLQESQTTLLTFPFTPTIPGRYRTALTVDVPLQDHEGTVIQPIQQMTFQPDTPVVHPLGPGINGHGTADDDITVWVDAEPLPTTSGNQPPGTKIQYFTVLGHRAIGVANTESLGADGDSDNPAGTVVCWQEHPGMTACVDVDFYADPGDLASFANSLAVQPAPASGQVVLRAVPPGTHLFNLGGAELELVNGALSDPPSDASGLIAVDFSPGDDDLPRVKIGQVVEAPAFDRTFYAFRTAGGGLITVIVFGKLRGVVDPVAFGRTLLTSDGWARVP